MSTKKKQILYWTLFAIYVFFVFSPFIFPGLNVVEPVFLGTPFTMWYTNLVILVGCGLVFYGSKKLWQSFDETNDNGEEI